jgi:hypothetical protein
MGVDHGGRHIGVSEQLLDSPDVLTGLRPLDCEGVRQPDPACPGVKILFMKFSHQFDMMLSDRRHFPC